MQWHDTVDERTKMTDYKDKLKSLVMRGFVSDCVQYCVDLEKGWYK